MSSSNKLRRFLSAYYPELRLGAGLFYRWGVALRFDLYDHAAAKQRAVALYEASFLPDDDCLVVSQDWPTDKQTQSLFHLRGSGLAKHPEILDADTDPHEENDRTPLFMGVVQPARSFRYDLVFEAIGNSDFATEPRVSSRVYFCNLRSALVFHMYDDRGLDVIAPNIDILRYLYQDFNAWLLTDHRQRIEAAFG